MATLPKGFKCEKCGEYHKFALYVFAHWTDKLVHKCECGAEHVIQHGMAKLSKCPRKVPTP